MGSAGRTAHTLAILFVLLSIVLGCQKRSALVTVVPRATGPLLRDAFRKGVQATLSQSDLRLLWKFPSENGDVQDQIGALAEAVSGSAGIIFSPQETLVARSLVLRAAQNHVPTVVVNDEDFGPPAGPYLSYVSNDEREGARLAAERLAQDLHGRGTVAVVGIGARQEDSLTREIEFERRVKEIAPGISFTLRQWGDLEVTHQQQICQELLSAPRPPDGIVALSSTATRGALYAKLTSVQRAKRPILIGFDQDDSAMLWPIVTGDIDALVIQNEEAIGRRAAANVQAQIAGQPFPARTRVAPSLITRSDLLHPSASPLVELPNVPSNEVSETTASAMMAALVDDAKRHELQPGVQSIAEFIRSPGQHPSIMVQGTVVSLPPMLEVQDDTSAVLIPSFTTSSQLRIGDEVTVQGDLTSERFRSRIDHAKIHVLWSGNPVAPLAVTALQLTAQYRGESIEIEGTVLRDVRSSAIPELILEDGTQSFRALLSGPKVRTANFAPGSRVRLYGTATASPDLTYGIFPFAVVVNNADELSPPPWWSPVHIALTSLAAAFVLFALFWAFHGVQRWHMRSVLREREQLAFEMHDTLAQSFTGISYQLIAAQEQIKNGTGVEAYLNHALQMVRSSHREASNTIAFLRPRHRDSASLIEGLQQTAERLSASGSLTVTTSLLGESKALPLEVGDALFRIGQEAISNAIQHGGCRNLAIALSVSKRMATLTIRDDGVGFAMASTTSGLGLKGMRQRAEGVKGSFHLVSASGSGTTVTVTCPLIIVSGLASHVRARVLSKLRALATDGVK